MRIALAQLDIAVGRPVENLRRAEIATRKALEQGAELVLLPELWLHGYDLERAQEYAQAFAETLRAEWATLAREAGCYMAGSVLAPNPAGQPSNTAFVLSPAGTYLAAYRKVHPFGPMGETRHLAPGEAMPSFDLPWGRSALAICYDLRFPEPFRHYTLTGAVLILLPAQWPAPRIEHWRILLRARAIENQCFIVACNRVGRDPDGTTFGGHSAVIGPWGQVLVEGGTEKDLLVADVDLEEVTQIRTQFPVLQDRRQDLYPWAS